jgi:hypothetical protein
LDIPGRGNVRTFIRLGPRVRRAYCVAGRQKADRPARRGELITALPKKEADAPEWQAAIEALMLVVDLGGPTMFARIGIMQALNRDHVREFSPSQKQKCRGES